MSCWSDKLCITPPAAKNSNALKNYDSMYEIMQHYVDLDQLLIPCNLIENGWHSNNSFKSLLTNPTVCSKECCSSSY